MRFQTVHTPTSLTEGPISQALISFALPLLLGNLFQQLYNTADSLIVGNFLGSEALAAVSSSGNLIFLMVGLVNGVSMGAGVVIARYFGAKDYDRMQKTIHTLLAFGLVAGALLTVVGVVLSPVMLRLMDTPETVLPDSISYFRTYFTGSLAFVLYNICMGILQAVGDSRHPLQYLIISSIVNIALDYYFMGTLHLGPAGAALGTTLSQAVSVLVSLAVILKRRLISVRRADFRPQRAVMGKLLQIGVPVALQDGFIQVSFVIITIIANRRGLTDAAAVGIVEKIIGFLFLIPSSMLSTVSALGAQNIGAGKPERARLTLRYAAMIACSFGITIVILTQFIAEPLVGLFTPDAAVAAAGGQYLRGYIWDSFFAGVQFSFSGYFCACGKSGISFLHNSLSILLVRVPGAYLASKYFPQTLLPMGLANAAGSLFSILVCVIAYTILTRREKRAQEAT